MTDFFTRLAERTLGLALIVQPNLASLYALEQYQNDSDASDVVLTDEPAAQVTRASTPLISSQEVDFLEIERGESSRIRGGSGVEEELGRLHPTRPVPSSEAPMTEGGTSVPATEQRRGRNSEEAGSPDQVDRRRATQAPPQPPQLHDHVKDETVKEPIAQPIPQIYPPPAILPEQRRWEEEMIAPAPRPLVEPRIVSVEATARRSSETKAIQPQMMPVAEKKRPNVPETPVPTPEAAPPPMPTVHVTIGRIEVRATPPPATTAQAQRQKPAPTVMSLDDYLHQQAKGGRS